MVWAGLTSDDIPRGKEGWLTQMPSWILQKCIYLGNDGQATYYFKAGKYEGSTLFTQNEKEKSSIADLSNGKYILKIKTYIYITSIKVI